MLGRKPIFILILLILLYGWSLVTQRHFYPIVAFNMFAETHSEPEGIIYTPYAISKSGEMLLNEKFNPWPIRRTDLHKTIERWAEQNTLESNLSELNPRLFKLIQELHGHSHSREEQYKCFGILRLEWLLSTPPHLRSLAMKSTKLIESCNEK